LSKEAQWIRDLALLGRAVRELREQRRLSQAQLAAATGVPQRRIGALEAGRLDPDYVLLVALARALGVRPVTLVIRAEGLAEEEPLG
jgi:transcriptional regulator with XRE-family HTH domain